MDIKTHLTFQHKCIEHGNLYKNKMIGFVHLFTMKIMRLKYCSQPSSDLEVYCQSSQNLVQLYYHESQSIYVGKQPCLKTGRSSDLSHCRHGLPINDYSDAMCETTYRGNTAAGLFRILT